MNKDRNDVLVLSSLINLAAVQANTLLDGGLEGAHQQAVESAAENLLRIANGLRDLVNREVLDMRISQQEAKSRKIEFRHQNRRRRNKSRSS